MAKRGAQEGSVFRRKDGRWAATLHVGYAAGRRVRKTYYAGTRQEAAARLAAAVRDRQLGKNPVPEQERVGVFLTQWLEDTHRRAIRLTTYRGYEVVLRKHVIPALGDVRLARLTAADLDALYGGLLSRGLSPRTVRLCHAVIHRGLSHALRRGAVAVNVADAVDTPRVPRKEFRCLGAEEAGRLLKTARDDRLYGLFVLALSCGLRQAELLGIRWADIDLNGATLSVRQQVYRLNGEWQFTEPKTAKGRRTVSLSATAVEALRERRLAQRLEEVRAETWEDLDLVFTTMTGGPIGAQVLRRSFWPLLAKASLPRVRFHDLRHACASLLLAEGVHPKVVQEMLGHSSIAVTMDIYSHTLPNMQADAAERMDRLLAASGP